jgi:hypothetical protein
MNANLILSRAANHFQFLELVVHRFIFFVKELFLQQIKWVYKLVACLNANKMMFPDRLRLIPRIPLLLITEPLVL